MKKFNTVITYGTFDMFHAGHERLLKRISEQTDKMFVGVSSDDWNAKKGKKSFQTQEERLNHVKKIPYVDGVFYEDHSFAEEQWKEDYERYNAEAVIMGSDHEGNLNYLKEKGLNIQYLSRTEGVSSTELRKGLSEGKSLVLEGHTYKVK